MSVRYSIRYKIMTPVEEIKLILLLVSYLLSSVIFEILLDTKMRQL